MTGKTQQEEGESENVTQSKTLDGKTFVITGKLEGMTRTEAESMVRQNGGNAASSVTKNTDYLVAGEKPGSKLAKAEKLGVETIGQHELEKMLA